MIRGMVHRPISDADDECLHLPLDVVRFPVEWRPGEDFRADDLSTWPRLEGRLEYVDGRIRYLPPCGGVQQLVVMDVVGALLPWVRTHPEYALGGNEAGMKVGPDVRAADAAVWRKTDIAGVTGLPHALPVLAAEVAGKYDTEEVLREKVAWYLNAGVEVVWLVVPSPRHVIVATRQGERRYQRGERIPEHPSLPGLSPAVSDCFLQIDADRP